MKKINPQIISKSFRESVHSEILANQYKINIVGFMCNDDPAAKKYADYTKAACEEVGINFDLRIVPRVQIEDQITLANEDDRIHGIFIYYPIFGLERDAYIKNLVSPYKDIEGLNQYWASKLYQNQRFEDQNKNYKSILPCTPLAIIKILEEIDISVRNRTVSVFNRSEVVGRPLASMLSHDGAKVYSFDLDGVLLFHNGTIEEIDIDREKALASSDIVITGVPSKKFEMIRPSEIQEGIVGLNFSTIQNFEKATLDKLSTFIPRVGPLTVTMCLRNSLRLYKNYFKG